MLKLHLDNLTRHGIDAVRSGNTSAGRGLLEQAVKEEPNNVLAWHWLASIEPDAAERKRYLERVLEIDPKNTFALRDLAEINAHRGVPMHTPSATTFGRPARSTPAPQRGNVAIPKSSAQAPRPWPGYNAPEAGTGPGKSSVSANGALEDEWATAAIGMRAGASSPATTGTWPASNATAVPGGQRTAGLSGVTSGQSSAMPATPPTGRTTAMPATGQMGQPPVIPTTANPAVPTSSRGATPAANPAGTAVDSTAGAGLGGSALTHDQLLSADDVVAMVGRQQQPRVRGRTRSGPPYMMILVILMLLGMGLVAGMVARHVVTARTPSQVSRTSAQPGRTGAQPNRASSGVKDTSSNAQDASQTKDTSSQAKDTSSQTNNASGQTGDASAQTNDASSQANSESSQGNGAPAQINGVSPQANDTAAQPNDASAQTNGASPQANDTAAQPNNAAMQANSKPAPVANMLAAQPSTRTVHTGSGDFTIPGTAYLQNRPSTTGLDGSVVPVASEPFGSTDASSCTLPPGAAVLLLDSRTAGDGRLAFQVQNRECSGWVEESLLSSTPVNLGNVDPGTQDIWQPGK